MDRRCLCQQRIYSLAPLRIDMQQMLLDLTVHHHPSSLSDIELRPPSLSQLLHRPYKSVTLTRQRQLCKQASSRASGSTPWAILAQRQRQLVIPSCNFAGRCCIRPLAASACTPTSKSQSIQVSSLLYYKLHIQHESSAPCQENDRNQVMAWCEKSCLGRSWPL